MTEKPKIFPWGLALTLLLWTLLGCGAAGRSPQETPCEKGCADGFVACLEDCIDDGACRDECMSERSRCEHACKSDGAEPADGGAPAL